MERKTRELQAKQALAAQERRRLEEERLLAALATNLSFHKGRPLAAVVVFRCDPISMSSLGWSDVWH